MYNYLKGTITSSSTTSCVVEVAGIGYNVVTPKQIPTLTTCIWTNTQLVKEELIIVGFAHQVERDLFTKLVNIKGIGIKIASNTIKQLSTKEIEDIFVGNTTNIANVQGLTKKIYEKIRDSLPGFQNSPVFADALLALETLGYKKESIKHVFGKLKTKEYDTKELVITALKSL